MVAHVQGCTLVQWRRLAFPAFVIKSYWHVIVFLLGRPPGCARVVVLGVVLLFLCTTVGVLLVLLAPAFLLVVRILFFVLVVLLVGVGESSVLEALVVRVAVLLRGGRSSPGPGVVPVAGEQGQRRRFRFRLVRRLAEAFYF